MRREIGMGKTALAMNIAEHVAFVEDKPVAVFSLKITLYNSKMLVDQKRRRESKHGKVVAAR